MKLLIEIELGNDAMRTGIHVGSALQDLGGHLRHEYGRHELTFRTEGRIGDVNGNTVGSYRVDPDERDAG